jgi:hypothetical protein
VNWINIPVALLRSPEFIGADPEQRATWLSLLGHCCEQENGGRISGCREWKCRRWQQTCGVTLDEVNAESDLWQWDEDTIEVAFYPVEKEAEVRAKREAGATGGRRSGRSRRQKTKKLEAVDEAQLQAVIEAELQGELQRKGKEGKGIEGNRKGKEVRPALSEPLGALWSLCPAKGRERSSKKKVATAWKNLKPQPTVEAVTESLRLWIDSDEWSREDGRFVPALDRWLRDRKFDTVPSPKTDHRSQKAASEFAEDLDIQTLKL